VSESLDVSTLGSQSTVEEQGGLLGFGHGVICYLVLIGFNPHCVQAMPRPDNDNTERELIELLTRVLSDFFKEDRHAIAGLSARVALLEENSHIRHLQIMTALETLTESVNANTQGQANLTTAVNAAIVQLGTPGATDAQLLTLAAAIDQNTQSDKSLTDALIAAVNPTPTP
jgi:hypothetical protein